MQREACTYSWKRGYSSADEDIINVYILCCHQSLHEYCGCMLPSAQWYNWWVLFGRKKIAPTRNCSPTVLGQKPLNIGCCKSHNTSYSWHTASCSSGSIGSLKSLPCFFKLGASCCCSAEACLEMDTLQFQLLNRAVKLTKFFSLSQYWV